MSWSAAFKRWCAEYRKSLGYHEDDRIEREWFDAYRTAFRAGYRAGHREAATALGEEIERAVSDLRRRA